MTRDLTIASSFCGAVAEIDNELRKGDASRLAPYVAELRSFFDPPTAVLPNYWDEEARALLRDVIPSDINQHEASYSYWCKPTADDRRALMLAVSRMTTLAESWRRGQYMMVPFYDAINHCSGRCDNVGVAHPLNSSTVLRARHAVEGGTQLFLRYAETAADLLLNHGFVSTIGKVGWHVPSSPGAMCRTSTGWAPCTSPQGEHRFDVDEKGVVDCTAGCDASTLSHDATALLATVRERLSAAEALQLRLVGRGQPPARARLAEVQMAHAYLEAMHSALERAIDWANSVATARTELR